LFEFLAAAAGASVVAAGFGARAAIGLLGNLCIFVHEIGILGGGLLGDGFLSGFWEGGSGATLLRGAGQGVAEDEDGGAETGAGGGFRVLEDLFEGLESQGSAGDGLFVQHVGAFVLGVAEGRLKGRRGVAPIGDGVAVNAGLVGGGIEVGAVQQGVDNLELRSGEGGIGHCSYLSATTIACERVGIVCREGADLAEVLWNEGGKYIFKICDRATARARFFMDCLQA